MIVSKLSAVLAISNSVGSSDESGVGGHHSKSSVTSPAAASRSVVVDSSSENVF